MTRKDYEELAAFDNSEVLRNFVKIAYDSGLVEKDDVEPKLETVDDGKTIESKYHTQKDIGPDNDGRELVDEAHPGKAGVVDSYLTDGDIVEDIFEAHDIGVNIATKGPEFNDWSHKNIAAIHSLVESLIAVADEMDIREQNDISKFADDIIVGITHTGDAVKKKIASNQIEEIIKEAGAASAAGSLFSRLGGWWRLIPMAAALGLGGYLISQEMHSGYVKSVSASFEILEHTINKYIETKEGIDTSTTDIQLLRALLEKLRAAVNNFVEKSRALNAIDILQAMYVINANEQKAPEQKEQELQRDFEEYARTFDEFMAAKQDIDKAFIQQGMSQEELNKILEEMSRAQPGTGEDTSSTWENIKGQIKNVFRAVHSEESESKSALTAFNASINYEVSRKAAARKHIEGIYNNLLSSLKNNTATTTPPTPTTSTAPPAAANPFQQK